MDTIPPSLKHKSTLRLAVLSVGNVASWIKRSLGRETPFTNQEALQSLRHLSDRDLHDIGMWRDSESRTDAWWRINPPS